MSTQNIFEKYELLFNQLKLIIIQSEARILQDEPDDFFVQHVNFLTKSYLITICTYLEAFLQDLAFEHVVKVNERIARASIPKNIVVWAVSNGSNIKEKEWSFSTFDLQLTKKHINEELSGNPHKTINLFKCLGLNLRSENNFERCKDLVGSIVDKRNNIIHHNDNAMDISLSDLRSHIDSFLIYMKAIDAVVHK